MPSIVERTLIRPPSSRIGTITEEERAAIITASPIGAIYDKVVDRQSAFEILKAKVDTKAAAEPPAETPADAPSPGGVGGMLEDILGLNVPRNKRLSTTQKAAREVSRTVSGEIGKALGGSVGREIFRSVLGGILRR